MGSYLLKWRKRKGSKCLLRTYYVLDTVISFNILKHLPRQGDVFHSEDGVAPRGRSHRHGP